jgi:hypothetical protein
MQHLKLKLDMLGEKGTDSKRLYFEEKKHAELILFNTGIKKTTWPHRVVEVLHFACFACTCINIVDENHGETQELFHMAPIRVLNKPERERGSVNHPETTVSWHLASDSGTPAFALAQQGGSGLASSPLPFACDAEPLPAPPASMDPAVL